MGSKEKQIINDVLLEGSKKGRLFRANAGISYNGKILHRDSQTITIAKPRRFHGMPAGTPDVIGWETKEIAAPCCGSCFYYSAHDQHNNRIHDSPICQFKKINVDPDSNYGFFYDCYQPRKPKKIAVFKAVEVKTGKQKLSEKQENFKRKLLEDGGIYEEKRD